MEVINLGSSRKFLRERPIRLKLFDRPRLVGELICLEPGQQDMKRTYEASDALYVIVEGHGHLKTEVQGQVLDRLDALVVPPGVEHFLVNDGSEQMTALVMLSPNPLFDSRRDFSGSSRGRPAERGTQTERPRASSRTGRDSAPDRHGEEPADHGFGRGSLETQPRGRPAPPRRDGAPFRSPPGFNQRPGQRPAPYRDSGRTDSRGPPSRPPIRGDSERDNRPGSPRRAPFVRNTGPPRRPRGSVAGARPINERDIATPRGARPYADPSTRARPPFRRDRPPTGSLGRPNEDRRDAGRQPPFRSPARSDSGRGDRPNEGPRTAPGRPPRRGFHGPPANAAPGPFRRPPQPRDRRDGIGDDGGRPAPRGPGYRPPSGGRGAGGARPGFGSGPGPRGARPTNQRGRPGPGRNGPRTSGRR